MHRGLHIIYKADVIRNVAGGVVQEACEPDAYLPSLISWEEEGNVSGRELLKPELPLLTVSSPHCHFSPPAGR